MHEDIEALATDGFDDESEDVGAEIRVDVALTGLALERRRENRGARLVSRARDAPQISPSRQSGAMSEQLADGDGILPTAGESWQVGGHRRLEVEATLIE